MPKDSLLALPLSGLFAVVKPSGQTSMSVVNDIRDLINDSKLFVEADKLKRAKNMDNNRQKRRSNKDMVKIGQGGTLDPLADGVLVIGIGKGTKKLSEFLDCVKEYKTTCLLGCETDSYDSEGAQVCISPWRHVTREMVEAALPQFRGNIEQTPPIFSALKMDGKPLYEYARSGIPLPRKIDKRPVTIHTLEIVEWKGSDHDFQYPEKKLTEDEKKALERALQNVEKNPTISDIPDVSQEDGKSPTAFVLKMKVSGGTYVRSLVHDLGHAVGSAAHVVTLTRSRQGRFSLEPSEGDIGCVPWKVIHNASEAERDVSEDGYIRWEREVLDKFEVVEEKKGNGNEQ